MEDGCVLNNQYQIIREIGMGGMGVIYLAYHLHLKKYVVLKRIKDDYIGAINVRSEVDMLKELHHPYLPQVYDFLQMGSKIYTVIDFIEGHDLEWYIQNHYYFAEEQICKWLKQMLEVLQYLHSRKPKIIHFDIKPANIIINQREEAVLIDFNISFEENNMDVFGFSQAYASPEQMEYANQVKYYGNSNIQLDERTDIYSLGATFYCLMTEMNPYLAVQQGYYLRNLALPYSQSLCRIIDKAMEQEINRRYSTAGEMLKAVETIIKSTWKYRLKIIGLCMAVILCITSSIIVGINIYHHSQQKNQEEFLKAYNEVLYSYENEHNTKQLNQAMNLLNNSDYEELLEEDQEKKGMLFYFMADAYAAEEKSKEVAVEYYQKALELYESSDIYRDYALTLAELGEYVKAKAVLKKANLKTEEEIMFLGQILRDEGKYIQAIKTVEQLKNSNDKELLEQIWKLELYCYEKLGDKKQVSYCYEQLERLEQGE